MIDFNSVTTLDHCGVFVDRDKDVIINPQINDKPSLFERKINSKSPHSVRKYEAYLKGNIEKNEYEKVAAILYKIISSRKLT